MQISKLAIGTAQFGLNYGINKAAPVNLKEIRRILNFAKNPYIKYKRLLLKLSDVISYKKSIIGQIRIF